MMFHRSWFGVLAACLLFLFAASAAAQDLEVPETDPSAPIRIGSVRTDAGRDILWRAGRDTAYTRMLNAANAGRPADRRLTEEQFDAANACRVIYVCERRVVRDGHRRLVRELFHNGANEDGTLCGYNRRYHASVTDPIDFDEFACDGRRLRWLINGVSYHAPLDARLTTSRLARDEIASADAYLTEEHPSAEIATRAATFATTMENLIDRPTSPGFATRGQMLATVRLNTRFLVALNARLASERASAATSASSPRIPIPASSPVVAARTPAPIAGYGAVVYRDDPSYKYATLALVLTLVVLLILFLLVRARRPRPLDLDQLVSTNGYVRATHWLEKTRAFLDAHPGKRAFLEEHFIRNLAYTFTGLLEERTKMFDKIRELGSAPVVPIPVPAPASVETPSIIVDPSAAVAPDPELAKLREKVAALEQGIAAANARNALLASDNASLAKRNTDLVETNARQKAKLDPMPDALNGIYAHLWLLLNAVEPDEQLFREPMTAVEAFALSQGIVLTPPTIRVAGPDAQLDDTSNRPSRSTFGSLGEAMTARGGRNKKKRNGNGKPNMTIPAPAGPPPPNGEDPEES